MIGGITDLIIGVRDPAPWRALLSDQLGFTAIGATDHGPFGVAAASVTLFDQARAGTGRIRLVQYPNAPEPPRPAIRDLGFFDLDIYSRDNEVTYRTLSAAGYVFRAKPETWSVQSPPITLNEGMIEAPDGVNLVFIQSANPRGAAAWANDPDRHYSEVSSSVAVIPDLDASIAFWRDALGMQLLLDFYLDHPALENLLGMPKGEGFRMALLANAGQTARVELIALSTESAPGVDRRPTQCPGMRGIIGWSFQTPHLSMLLAAMQQAGAVVISEPSPVSDGVHGQAFVATARTPDGLMIEVWQAR